MRDQKRDDEGAAGRIRSEQNDFYFALWNFRVTLFFSQDDGLKRSFTMDSMEDGRRCGVLTKEGTSTEYTVAFRKFWPPEGSTIDYVPLRTGDSVQLLPFTMSSKCFIYPSDEDILDLRSSVFDAVNLEASKSLYLSLAAGFWRLYSNFCAR